MKTSPATSLKSFTATVPSQATREPAPGIGAMLFPVQADLARSGVATCCVEV